MNKENVINWWETDLGKQQLQKLHNQYYKSLRDLHHGEVWIARKLLDDLHFLLFPEKCEKEPFQTSEASKPLPPPVPITYFEDCLVPLEYFGLPPPMIAFYRKRGITKLYEWQGRCLLTKGVLEGQNLMYSAPTSGGKTLVAELLMCRRLFHNPYKNRAIIILPYVSLVVEKYEQLQSVLHGQYVNGEKLKIGCYYGNKGGNHKREHIVICTIEKANSIINHLIKTKSIQKYKTVIVDEAHMIGDPKRGYLLEIVLNKLLFLQEVQSLDLQIIALSATLPNIDEMIQYLHAQKYVATQRPNHLTEWIICDNNIYDNHGTKISSYQSFFASTTSILPFPSSLSTRFLLLDLVNRQANQDKQIILFVPTKVGCGRTVNDLMKYIDYQPTESPSILSNQVNERDLHKRQEIVNKLKEEGCSDEMLLQAVERGMCYHHAGLTINERQVLEDAVRTQVLRVIVATTTLAVGVDFPVDVVILNTVKSGIHTLSSGEYRQMAGRAGRRSSGEVFVLENYQNLSQVVSLMTASLPSVQSALSSQQRGLSRALLEAIYLGLITNLTTLKTYLSCTLISLQCTSEEYLKNILESISYLQSHDIIYSLTINNTLCLQCSQLGCALSTCSLPIEEAILLYRDLFNHQTHISLQSVLFLIYFITPTFMIPSVRWEVFERLYQQLNPNDRIIANRLQIEEEYISYCQQYHPPVYEPKQYQDPSLEDLKNLTHRRFYGALLLRDLGNAQGQEIILTKIQTLYHVDRGDLQRFWEAAELYLQLVITMCESLNWKVMKRLLGSLKTWFKKKLPKSYVCFLKEDDKIPFPCIQYLAKEEWTIRDIAETTENQLAKVLCTGLAVPFGITDIHSLLTIQQKKEENGSIIQVRRRDYEYFNQDMTHVASVLIQRAKERRNELMMNRSANLLLKELEDEKELSFLVTPLVSEKREWLNTFENTQSDDGIPSEGVLSDSDEDHSETIASIESQSKRMHLSEDENSLQSSQSSQFSLLPTNQLTNQACHHYSSKSFQNSFINIYQSNLQSFYDNQLTCQVDQHFSISSL